MLLLWAISLLVGTLLMAPAAHAQYTTDMLDGDLTDAQVRNGVPSCAPYRSYDE